MCFVSFSRNLEDVMLWRAEDRAAEHVSAVPAMIDGFQ
jgi:hypothetical protein